MTKQTEPSETITGADLDAIIDLIDDADVLARTMFAMDERARLAHYANTLLRVRRAIRTAQHLKS